MKSILPPRSVASTFRWFAVFTVLIFAKIMLIWWMAKHQTVRLFSEDSMLEWMQFANLLLAAGFTGVAAYRIPSFRQLLLLLGMLPLLAAIREQDAAFDPYAPWFGWQTPFYVVALIGLIYGLRRRKALIAQIARVHHHRSVGILWAGFILAIPFGQMVGHRPFLSALFDVNVSKPITRIIEECAESIGYLMIFFGLIDLSRTCWHLHREAKKSANAEPQASSA